MSHICYYSKFFVIHQIEKAILNPRTEELEQAIRTSERIIWKNRVVKAH